jgi:hypothetical protein
MLGKLCRFGEMVSSRCLLSLEWLPFIFHR